MNKLKVLLAEDHAFVREMIARYLRSQPNIGLVVEVSDGEQAVLQADRLHPDIVLLDLHMPKRDGLDVTRHIKHNAPATRVYILSVHADQVYRAQAKDHAADGLIDKNSLKHGLSALLANAELSTAKNASHVAAA